MIQQDTEVCHSELLVQNDTEHSGIPGNPAQTSLHQKAQGKTSHSPKC